jgi:hypothetical protein
MCHRALLDATFRAFLLRIDEDLAAETRAGGCRRCGAALHRDLYPRKSRGGPGDPSKSDRRRLSFTCSICDKTPHTCVGSVLGSSRLPSRYGGSGECLARRSERLAGEAADRVDPCSQAYAGALARVVGA